MSYECTWLSSAGAALDEILASASDRAELARGLKEFETQLSSDPFAVGESRGHTHERIAFVDRLAILYFVKSQEPTVVIYGVWTTR
jgi:hypothetical protein